jgi:hypothetical protein
MPSEADLKTEIAATAARLIAEEGCDYGQAKRRAVHELLGEQRGTLLPDNAEVERELRRYLQLFEGQAHRRRLAVLRAFALDWMERLADFEPHLAGAVLNGTATEHSDIHLQLFVDSAKDVEMALINAGIDFDVDDGPDERPRVMERLTFLVPAAHDAGLPTQRASIGIQLHVYPRDAIRVASRGKSDRALEPELHPVEATGRAGLAAVRRLVEETRG